jgi:hypothetical protein
VVKEQNAPRAEQLYLDGKELYKESKDTTPPHFVIYDDSSYLYIKEKADENNNK